jgi:hypothetical protein
VESTGEANVLKLIIKTNQMQKMKKKRNKNKRIIKFFKKLVDYIGGFIWICGSLFIGLEKKRYN